MASAQKVGYLLLCDRHHLLANAAHRERVDELPVQNTPHGSRDRRQNHVVLILSECARTFGSEHSQYLELLTIDRDDLSCQVGIGISCQFVGDSDADHADFLAAVYRSEEHTSELQ